VNAPGRADDVRPLLTSANDGGSKGPPVGSEGEDRDGCRECLGNGPEIAVICRQHAEAMAIPDGHKMDVYDIRGS